MGDALRMPNDIQAERAVLGCCILEPECWVAVSSQLRPEDFYDPKNATVYRAMQALAAKNDPLDTELLRSHLQLAGRLDAAGGWEYLAALTDTIPTVQNAEHHAKRVHELSQVRRVMRSALQIAQEGSSPIHDVNGYLERAESLIRKATEDRSSGMRFVSMAEAVSEAYAELCRRQAAAEHMLGYSTGFTELDEALGGLGRKDLIVVAARPGMGKTAFANGIKLGVARSTKKLVLSLELEMSREQFSHRVLASEGGVNLRRVRAAKFDAREASSMAKAAAELSSLPIHFIEQRHAKLSDFRREAARMQRQHGEAGLVVVDYVQIAKPDQREDSREREVASMTAALKTMAGDFDCPVLALSQLNRGVESRQDKRPMLSDLRESGAIEQDADTVIFLYRDEVYNPGSADKGICEVIIAKQRSGAMGTVKLRWSGYLTRFDNLDYQRERAQEERFAL